MSKQNQIAVGIKHHIIDQDTGVPTQFHTVSMLAVDFDNGVHSVTVNHYFSQDLFDLGKKPFRASRYELYGTPPRGGDIVDWALKSIVAPISDGAVDVYGQPLQANDFTGAELVYRDFPEQ
ncbi:putative phage associated protein [Neisseria animaloris]|uniref:hypothetical protein n=1 Tax=Neisseria animaloris TaxID=326522 RepID=UPI000A198EFF|nr:hypothetical protein [Neisseria animaloris]OSI06791.1 hypothetical protein BWD08_10530 [Neisseria animaloris]VEH86571.1 putative phage associated protein [Neisseria animaloris]